ncbi:MAG TPA: hypothetical protein VF875_05625 [Anaeromyxobacter sp.]
MERRRRWAAVAVGLLVAGGPDAARAEGEAAAPLADDPTLIALAVALACAEPLVPPQAPAGGPAPSGAELELVTTVRARSLRLDAIPRLDGVLRGVAGRRTSWRAERVNLPARPEPGAVYRDVEVRLTLSTDVDGLAALLREAKQAARGLRLEEGDGPAQDVVAQPLVVPELVGSVESAAATATATAAAIPIPTVPAPPPVLDDGPAAATTTSEAR